MAQSPVSEKNLHSRLTYKTRRERLRLGGFELEIETLDSLNETIDQVFDLLLREGRPELLERLCPYFGVIWPSAFALGKRLAEVPSSQVLGTELIELGCGLAIPSLVAARRGARVTAADFHPEVPRFLESNRRLNGAPLRYLEVDWLQGADLPQQTYDWVIGSDILYEAHYAEPVARAFSRLVKPGGRIMLADPGRPYLQLFHDEMRKLGISLETSIEIVEAPEKREIFILEGWVP